MTRLFTWILAVLLIATASCGGVADAIMDRSAKTAGFPRQAPIFGVDFIYQDAPHVLVRALADPAQGDALGTFLKRDLGISTIRFNSFGFYSYLGPLRSRELRESTQQTNRFPWFPVEQVARFVERQGLGIVIGVNPEDGADAAVALVERFRREGAFDRIVAVEIGNEPHLSKRPWQPEEYAERAAEIVEALTPLGLRCAVALTVGKEAKTPTGISDDDYTRRTLAALDARVPLAERADLYGVIHLYSRGVTPKSIDMLNRLVRPVAPRMRYLVTEYNIRSSLAENDQLTNDYGLEFAEKTGQLVLHPDIAGLFVHGVPYHSVAYWSGDRGVVTVSGYGDPRVTGEAASPGWHLTPAGRLYGLFVSSVWSGVIQSYEQRRGADVWRTMTPSGLRLGVLNTSNSRFSQTLDLGGRSLEVALGPRSAAVYSQEGEVGRVDLPKGP